MVSEFDECQFVTPVGLAPTELSGSAAVLAWYGPYDAQDPKRIANARTNQRYTKSNQDFAFDLGITDSKLNNSKLSLNSL